MKCKSCNAEIHDSICPYCNTSNRIEYEKNKIAIEREKLALEKERRDLERDNVGSTVSSDTTHFGYGDLTMPNKKIQIIGIIVALAVFLTAVIIILANIGGSTGDPGSSGSTSKEIIGFTYTIDPSVGINNYKINYSGEVKNTGTKKINSVCVDVVIKINGTIVESTFTLVMDIEPGQSKAFSSWTLATSSAANFVTNATVTASLS